MDIGQISFRTTQPKGQAMQSATGPKLKGDGIEWLSEVKDTGIQWLSEVQDVVTAEVVEPTPEPVIAELVADDSEIITAEVVKPGPSGISWLGPVQYGEEKQSPSGWLIID